MQSTHCLINPIIVIPLLFDITHPRERHTNQLSSNQHHQTAQKAVGHQDPEISAAGLSQALVHVVVGTYIPHLHTYFLKVASRLLRILDGGYGEDR